MKNTNIETYRQRWLSLLELMIATLILVILTTVAIPSLKGFMGGKSIESIAKVFEQSIRSARSQAADRNTSIRVRPILNGSNWNEGFQLEFTNAANNTEIINQVEIRSNELQLTSPLFSSATPLTFDPSGTAIQTGSFTMKFSDCSDSSKVFTYTILTSGLMKKVESRNGGC